MSYGLPVSTEMKTNFPETSLQGWDGREELITPDVCVQPSSLFSRHLLWGDDMPREGHKDEQDMGSALKEHTV